MRSFVPSLLLATVLPLAVALQSGCEEKSKASPGPSSSSSAAPDDTVVLDPSMRKALAASSASASGGSRGDGPPESGVFDPGAADAVHARGKPVEVKLGTEGNEPRVTLGPAVPFKGTVVLSVGVRMGPRNALPTVDFTLEFAPEKADKPAEGAAAAMPATIVKIKKSELSKEQLGQVPEAAAKEVAKLKGSEMRIVRGPGGAASDMSVQLAKGAVPEFERTLVALADALMAFDVPAPPKPVGANAVWIAQSRHAYAGVDVVSYRMYTVTEVKGDDVTISVEVKQYAASPNLSFAGLPPEVQLTQFESVGTGELTVHKGEGLPRTGRFAQQMSLGMPGQGQNANRMMMLQLQSNVLLSR